MKDRREKHVPIVVIIFVDLMSNDFNKKKENLMWMDIKVLIDLFRNQNLQRRTVFI